MWQFAFQPRVWAVILTLFALAFVVVRYRQWRRRPREPLARRAGRAVNRRR